MVIEYIGEVIRTELSECREKQYEAKVNISLCCTVYGVYVGFLSLESRHLHVQTGR